MSNTIGFDSAFYASQNLDVVAAVSRGQFTSYQQHYDLFGRFEGRNPNAFFNTSFYLQTYQDVARAGVNPLTHFLNNGAAEGRFANAFEKAAIDVNNNGGADEFNEAAYRAQYQDVDLAIKAGTFKSGYQHFVQFGQFEARVATLANGTTITGPFTNTGTPVNAGTTFTLTDKLDSFTTVANGTVKGVISSNAADTTFGVADTISGGTANSKFDLTAVVGGTDVSTAGRTTSGIETFNIAFIDAAAGTPSGLTVDASTLTGAKTFNIASATAGNGDTVSFTGLAKTQSVQISSTDNDLGVKLEYKSGEDTGTADTASVSLNGAKVGAVTVAGNFETIAVNGTGTSEVASLNAAGAATSVTIGGAGATTINSITGLSTTASAVAIDASKATGAVTVGVNLASNMTVTGGSASDTLIATNATSTTIASTFKSTGVETILFAENGAGSAATSSIDLTNSTGVTTVGLRGSTTSSADSVTFNNVAAGTSVLLQGSKTAANQLVGSVTTTFTGATSSAPAAALTINVNNQGLDTGVTGTVENVISAGTVTADNVKAVTINASDADVSSFTLAASTLETLTVKATEDFVFGSTVGAAATTTAIDATGVAGKAQFTLVNTLAKSVAVSTGGGDDVLNLGTQNNNAGTSDNTITVNTGAGKDTVTSGSFSNKAVLKLDLGAGDDTFNVGNNTAFSTDKAHTIAFGEGTDTLRFEGANSSSLSNVAFTGLEKILVTGAGDLSLQAASLNGASIELTTIGTGRVIATGTGNADTIDLSKLTVVGPNGVNVNGGAGADTITLTTGKDSVIFADTAANNGSDTIRSFATGSTGDVLNVKAFIGATLDTTGGAGDASTLGVNLNADLNLSTNSANVVLGYNTAGALTSSLIVSAGTATAGEIIIGDGYKGFVAVATAATATSANLYYVEDTDATGGITGAATLVGVLNVATGTVAGLTTDNFVTN